MKEALLNTTVQHQLEPVRTPQSWDCPLAEIMRGEYPSPPFSPSLSIYWWHHIAGPFGNLEVRLKYTTFKDAAYLPNSWPSHLLLAQRMDSIIWKVEMSSSTNDKRVLSFPLPFGMQEICTYQNMIVQDGGQLCLCFAMWPVPARVAELVRVQQESSVSELAHLEVVLFSTVLLSDGAFPSSVLISM